jgi:protein TonB
MNERKANPERRAAGSFDDVRTGRGKLTQWLVHRAALQAPPDLSERLEEEWRADLATRPSSGSRLQFALGCCWATLMIAREHRPASIPVAGAVMMPKGTFGFGHDESGLFARRSFTFFLVAGLHIVLFYALMTGLAFRIIKEIPTSFQARMLQKPQAHPLPTLPPPGLQRSRIEIPPTEFPPMEPPVESGDIVAKAPEVPTSRMEAQPAEPSHVAVRVAGGPGSGFPSTDDYYPARAKRMEEQGVSTVRVCVGPDGRLTAVPTIAQSSGSPRIDDGALRLATAGSGHYRASTEDGRSVIACYAFRVRFALRTG